MPIFHIRQEPLLPYEVIYGLLEDEVVSQNGKIFISKIKEQMEKIDFLMQSMLKMSRLGNRNYPVQKKR